MTTRHSIRETNRQPISDAQKLEVDRRAVYGLVGNSCVLVQNMPASLSDLRRRISDLEAPTLQL